MTLFLKLSAVVLAVYAVVAVIDGVRILRVLWVARNDLKPGEVQK